MPPRSSPLPRSVLTKSWPNTSATMPRTVRVIMPIGMTLSVIAGSRRNWKCPQSHAQSDVPPGPAPMAGSHPSRTLKITTITMPSQ